MFYTQYDSPFGKILLTANNEGLTGLSFLADNLSTLQHDGVNTSNILTETCLQLEQYFTGDRRIFSIPLAPQGTNFQKKVWLALGAINHGETVSYLWVAKKINNERAVRAVGAANSANPIPLIVPCHRVIGTNGKLTGYSGGIGLKAKLLMHEGAHFKV
jgi:methylated-DNA-[protein]-cysteine S-methyltransferase